MRQTTNLKSRVVIFGSFYRGFHLLSHMLHCDEVKDRIQVVGVVTDTPGELYNSSHKRVWQYPHTESEERMVEELAIAHDLPVYKGRIKTDEFYKIYEHWAPDICLMGTFGQLINERLFRRPELGFYNLHPCAGDEEWPTEFAGPNPFHELMLDGRKSSKIACHKVDATFDTGALVAWSEPVFIPPNATVPDLHKATSPAAGRLAAQVLRTILDEQKLGA